jgi:hypothetical protein
MVPWNKLPEDLQKAVLAIVIVWGGTSAGCRVSPPICDPAPPPATTPMICDPPPPPPSSTPSPTITSTITPTVTASPTTTPMICDPPPPPPRTATPAGEGRLDPLPLAEIRSVDILWQGGLAFDAESPWPGADYRWSVSGGILVEEGGCMVWQPPLEPGRYLLQVVADWGRTGLAIDAATLIVDEDGLVSFG